MGSVEGWRVEVQPSEHLDWRYPATCAGEDRSSLLWATEQEAAGGGDVGWAKEIGRVKTRGLVHSQLGRSKGSGKLHIIVLGEAYNPGSLKNLLVYFTVDPLIDMFRFVSCRCFEAESLGQVLVGFQWPPKGGGLGSSDVVVGFCGRGPCNSTCFAGVGLRRCFELIPHLIQSNSITVCMEMI